MRTAVLRQQGLFESAERAALARLDAIWSELFRRGVELDQLSNICDYLLTGGDAATVDELSGHFAFDRATERRLRILVRFGIVVKVDGAPPRFRMK